MSERTPFQRRMRDLTEDNGVVMQRLADDWSTDPTTAGISVPLALNCYEEEVQLYLGYGFRHQPGDLGEKTSHTIRAHATDPEHPLVKLHRTRSHLKAQALFADALNSHPELAEATEYLRLGTLAHKHVGKDRAQRSVDAIYDLPASDDVKRALHLGFDFWIYYEARHNRQFQRGFDLTRLASTETATLVMRAALDRRVLTYALRDTAPQRAMGQELIAQFASTGSARDAMLGHVALLNDGRRSHSTRHYSARIDRAFLRRMELDRLDRLREELRKEHQKQREEHEQWFKEFRAKYGHLLDDNPPKNRQRQPEQQTIEQRVKQAIGAAHHSVRGTLHRFDQSVLAEVITEVDSLRSQTPDISTRGILTHFHYRGQLETALPGEVAAAKAIHLFSKVEKGEPKTLCF